MAQDTLKWKFCLQNTARTEIIRCYILLFLMILNSLMHPSFFLLIFLCTSITFLLVCLSWDKVLQGYSSNLVTYGMLFLGCWTCLFKFHRFTCIFPATQMCWELSSRAVCDTTMGHRFKFTFKPGFSQAFLVTAVAVLSTAMTLNFHVFLVFLHVSHCFLSNLLKAGLIKMGAKFEIWWFRQIGRAHVWTPVTL